jgi:hypothetical protein
MLERMDCCCLALHSVNGAGSIKYPLKAADENRYQSYNSTEQKSRSCRLRYNLGNLTGRRNIKWHEIKLRVTETIGATPISHLVLTSSPFVGLLRRASLTPAQEAYQISRRKEIYEALHPETKAGVAGGIARHGAANEKFSFAADTANQTGKDKRTIELSTPNMLLDRGRRENLIFSRLLLPKRNLESNMAHRRSCMAAQQSSCAE